MVERKGVHRVVCGYIQSLLRCEDGGEMVKAIHPFSTAREHRLPVFGIKSMQEIVAFGPHDPNNRIGLAIRGREDGCTPAAEQCAPCHADGR